MAGRGRDDFRVRKTPAWVERLQQAARGAGMGRAPEAEILTLAAALAPDEPNVDIDLAETSDELPAGEQARSAGRYAVCQLGAKRLAVAVEDVLEVRPMPRCANMPGAASFVRGVAIVRGEAISVLDLAALFKIENAGEPVGERLLLVKSAGQAQPVGMAVDAVLGFALLSDPKVVEDGEGDELASYICEVCRYEDKPVRLLDVQGLIGSGVIGDLADIRLAGNVRGTE